MNIRLSKKLAFDWKVEKIGVIGPGIVGMPMASFANVASALVRNRQTTPSASRAYVHTSNQAQTHVVWQVGSSVLSKIAMIMRDASPEHVSVNSL